MAPIQRLLPALLVLMGVACGHPPSSASQSSHAPPHTKATSLPGSKEDEPCDGSFALSVEVYVVPHGGSEELALSADGRLAFRRWRPDGEPMECTGRLEGTDSVAMAGRVEALALDELPELVHAPFVRDGTTIVVEGRCGSKSIQTRARNIFPKQIHELVDVLNENVLSRHCQAANARLPTSAELASWAETTGAIEMCARDCKQCNTCSL